jgi:hypothetical protein
VNRAIHNTIVERAARTEIAFRRTHGVISAEQAFYLVAEPAVVANPTEAGFGACTVLLDPTWMIRFFHTSTVMRDSVPSASDIDYGSMRKKRSGVSGDLANLSSLGIRHDGSVQ